MNAKDWPLYSGTKTLKAVPMTLGAYNEMRGWDQPADEDPDAPGYVVEYQDGGKPNVEGFDGYVSWSPEYVFNKAYRPCGTFEDRIKIEIAELEHRISKLETFINGDIFESDLSSRDQGLLKVQLHAMRTYREILVERYISIDDAPELTQEMVDGKDERFIRADPAVKIAEPVSD